jgi:hypothetical protein
MEEQDGFMPNQTNYDEKFFLNNLTKSFKMTEPAKIRITIPGFTISSLSDRVKYSIVLIKEDTSVAQNQQTTINILYGNCYPIFRTTCTRITCQPELFCTCAQ